MKRAHVFRWQVIVALCLFYMVGSCLAESKDSVEECSKLPAVSGLDVQKKLQPVHAGNSCFEQKLQNSTALNDGVIGPVTRQWIASALEKSENESSQGQLPAGISTVYAASPMSLPLEAQVGSANTYRSSVLAQPAASATTPAAIGGVNLVDPVVTHPYYAGMQPYVLFDDDIATLKLNQAVREILQAIVANPEVNQFVTLNAGLTYIAANIGSLDGITPELVEIYQKKLSSFFNQENYQFITLQTLEKLQNTSASWAAVVLNPYQGRLMPATLFEFSVRDILQQALRSSVQVQTSSVISNESETGVKSGGETDNEPVGVKPMLSEATLTELKSVMEIVRSTASTALRYELVYDPVAIESEFPSIEVSVAECMKYLANYVYPSAIGFADALNHLLLQMRVAGLQLLQSDTPPSPGFACALSEDIISGLRAAGNETPVTAESIRINQCAVMQKPLLDPALLVSLEPEQCQACVAGNCRSYKNYIDAVVSSVSKLAGKPYFRSDLHAINTAPLPECRECALPLQGVTYGFYPYWLASNNYRDIGVANPNPGYLNFSVFTRMAYFAIPIDTSGKIKDLLHWQNPRLLEGFVKQLSRLNVKRDIVLYASQWQNWKSTDDIKKYAEDHYKELVKLNKATEKYGGINGVTLYFDNYERSSNASSIITYVTRLHQEILKDSSADRPWLDINLLLNLVGLDDLKTHVGASVPVEQSYFSKLAPLFLNSKKDNLLDNSVKEIEQGSAPKLNEVKAQLGESSPQTTVANILVFLNESTSEHKKQLRMQLENEFKGEARVDAQEKIIPVLGRLALNEESNAPHRQFVDDLAYLKYNFGGIGFWKLPFTTEDEKGELNVTNTEMQILSHTLKLAFANRDNGYVDTEKMGWLGAALHQPSVTQYFSVCAFACPNRAWTLPLLLALLLGNGMVYVLYRSHCPSRMFIKAHYGSFLLLRWSPILLLIATFGCNPDLYPYSNKVLLLVLGLMLAIPLYRSFVRLSDRLNS